MDKKSEQKGKNKQPRVPPTFHQRFNIEVGIEETQKRFVNRIINKVGEHFPRLGRLSPGQSRYEYAGKYLRNVAYRLGEPYSYRLGFEGYVGGDFSKCMLAVEALYEALFFNSDDDSEIVSGLVQNAIKLNEIDLGIRWRNGHFWPSGAKLLDEALVNENLKWLSDPKYSNVIAPFEKGLSDYLEANRHPERLLDTVTDMYEALEALAKIVTGRPSRDLSANAELFVSKLNLSDYYKNMLKDYIEYANQYRHAIEPGIERKPPLPNEVEAFVYTTGLFIRLAIQQLATT